MVRPGRDGPCTQARLGHTGPLAHSHQDVGCGSCAGRGPARAMCASRRTAMAGFQCPVAEVSTEIGLLGGLLLEMPVPVPASGVIAP